MLQTCLNAGNTSLQASCDLPIYALYVLAFQLEAPVTSYVVKDEMR